MFGSYRAAVKQTATQSEAHTKQLWRLDETLLWKLISKPCMSRVKVKNQKPLNNL